MRIISLFLFFASLLFNSNFSEASTVKSFGNDQAKILSYCIKIIDKSIEKNFGRQTPFISNEDIMSMNGLRRDMVQIFTNNQDFIKHNAATDILVMNKHEMNVGRDASDKFFRKELNNCRSNMVKFTGSNAPQINITTSVNNKTTHDTDLDIREPVKKTDIKVPSYKSQAYLDRLNHCVIIAKAKQLLDTEQNNEGTFYQTKWQNFADQYAKQHSLQSMNDNATENAALKNLIQNGGLSVIKSEFSSCKNDLSSVTSNNSNKPISVTNNGVSGIPPYGSQSFLDEIDHCVIVAQAAHFVELKTNGIVLETYQTEGITYAKKWQETSNNYAAKYQLRHSANLGPKNNEFRKHFGKGEYDAIRTEFQNCKSQLN